MGDASGPDDVRVTAIRGGEGGQLIVGEKGCQHHVE